MNNKIMLYWLNLVKKGGEGKEENKVNIKVTY